MKNRLLTLETRFFNLKDVPVTQTEEGSYIIYQGFANCKIDRVPVTVFFTIDYDRNTDFHTLYLNVYPENTTEDDFESSEEQIIIGQYDDEDSTSPNFTFELS